MRQYTTHSTDNFEVITPSRVEFKHMGHQHYNAVLDNTIEMPLDRRSPTVGQLKLGVDHGVLAKQFLDGRFFIVDNQVVDFRLAHEKKFEHPLDSIKQLVDHLGFITAEGSSRIQACSETEKFECDTLNTVGGMFDIKIGFEWSPFSIDIHSYIEMWRQVCSNGAVAMSPIMNHRIPMMNQWKQNLDISNQVIRHNFDKIILPRMQAMPEERISVQDVEVLLRIVSDLKSSNQLSGDSIMHLANIEDKLDAVWDPAFDDLRSNMRKFIPAPVSAFDAYNIATEVGTHHVGRDRNNGKAQAFANNLLFNASRQQNILVDLDSLVTDTATFNDVDKAFFGETTH